ncbi:unnamed protein product [Arctogadus glacialis]
MVGEDEDMFKGKSSRVCLAFAYQRHSRCAPCESRFSGIAVERYTGGQRHPAFLIGVPARHRVRALQTHEGGEHPRLIFNILGCSQLEMRSKYDYEQVDGDSDKFC